MDECRAEKCKWKHPHKQFCPQEHDTFECGRNGGGCCRECYRLMDQKRASRPDRVEVRRAYGKSAGGLRTKRAYRGRPEVKAQRAAYASEYMQRPEVRKRRAEYLRAWNGLAEVRERKRQYKQRMPFEVYHRELLQNRHRLALKRLEPAVGASD